MLRFVLLEFSVLSTVAHVMSTGISIWRRGTSGSRHPATRDAQVSVVRAVCGLDDIERATLASSFALDPTEVELVFCCAREDDPAVPYLRALIDEHPEFDARVCIGKGPATANPKLDNMVTGWRF